MNTPTTGTTSRAAQRMRLHRKRRREGTYSVRVHLDPPEIDGLIRLRLLRREQRQDSDALQTAVMALIYRTLDR
jgi:hypothetical protein